MKLKADFHPRLFGFAGFSGSGKTTLIEKLIPALSAYSVGYLKHDAHKFEMDHPGKDTFRQYAAGAHMVMINDAEHLALQVRGKSFGLEKEFFQDCDLVLAEGHKYSAHHKFLFLDSAGEALREFQHGKITNVMAFISSVEGTGQLEGLPLFNHNDISGIMAFIINETNKLTAAVDLSGLILAGGMSTRMGQDKSLLRYHGTPQARHLFQGLRQAGLKAFLSCRAEQSEREGLSDLPTITDSFVGMGPLGGILSAMKLYPDQAFLVVACDLALVNTEHIGELIRSRDPLKQATAYFNQERNQFEPLFAIYEPKIYSRLLYFLGQRVNCPQKVLFNSAVKMLPLRDQGHLANVNTPEELKRIMPCFSTENV